MSLRKRSMVAFGAVFAIGGTIAAVPVSAGAQPPLASLIGSCNCIGPRFAVRVPGMRLTRLMVSSDPSIEQVATECNRTADLTFRVCTEFAHKCVLHDVAATSMLTR